MYMHVVKGKRVGDLQDISYENSISITNIVRKGKVKLFMSKPKVLLQVLWERVFMDTSRYEVTYYKL